MSDENNSSSSGGGCGCFGGGFTLGGIIAFALSWHTFHMFWWSVLAALFGYGYVIYWLIEYWK